MKDELPRGEGNIKASIEDGSRALATEVAFGKHLSVFSKSTRINAIIVSANFKFAYLTISDRVPERDAQCTATLTFSNERQQKLESSVHFYNMPVLDIPE